MEKITITPLEDVAGWVEADIRKDVCEENMSLTSFTAQFDSWRSTCIGKVLLQRKVVDTTVNQDVIAYPKFRLYFEHKEDYVRYLLTFDEYENIEVESAAYYCPYIPLTISNVASVGQNVSTPVIKFITRYDIKDPE